MPNNLTDNEIKKALETLLELVLVEGCLQRAKTISLALDLINRKDAQIERLKAENKNLLTFRVRLSSEISRLNSVNQMNENHIQKLKAERKRLTSGKCVYLSDDETTEYCVEGPCPHYKTVSEIKAEAYKEFAEELKLRTHEISYNTMQVVNKDDIDNLLNELVKE